jgi:putative ABC transport system substrate-binding protein
MWLVILALGILAAPLAAGAQPPAKIPRVGYLSLRSKPSNLDEAFLQGLREVGYVEGRTIALESRFAEGRPERFPALVADLVRSNVDVIVAGTTEAIQAAQAATRTIPIVMAVSGDPVGAGFVAGLARPGGNITGLSSVAPELAGKRLQLLREAGPRLSRAAVLRYRPSPIHAALWSELQEPAQVLGLALHPLEVGTSSGFEGAFAAMRQKRVGALLLLPEAFFTLHRKRITDLAAKNRMPAMYDQKAFVDEGGLMSYGPNIADMFRRAATFVDKILKGAKPADLPVEQPTRFELVVNLKAAKALGLTIPPSILIRADQVIQ